MNPLTHFRPSLTTPLGLVKAYCSNLQDDGSCLGANLNDDLTTTKCTPRPRCLLTQPGVRCQFFEEAVIPMNSGQWPGLQSAADHEQFAETVRDYRRAANVPSTHKRICPACQTRPLEPRKMRCYHCADLAKKEATRIKNQNRV